MENSITAQIRDLLEKDKTAKEVISMGYKSRTVYHVQARLKKQQRTVTPKVAKPNHISHQPKMSAPNADNLDTDPEIIQLQKDNRKAELVRKLKEISEPTQVAAMVDLAFQLGTELKNKCQYYQRGQDICVGLGWPEQSAIPPAAGKSIQGSDGIWRVSPSPLLCVLCPVILETRVNDLELKVSENPLTGIGSKYKCSNCGEVGLVCAEIICSNCRHESAYGWLKANNREN